MSAEATESKFFLENKSKSLNATLSSQENWQLDVKYYLQANDAIARVQNDIQEGALRKCELVRMQQLEKIVAQKCYKGNDFTFMQAQKCEQFHYKNDFKLNLIKSFVADHMDKHLQAYQSCWQNPSFEALPTNEDKDRAFLACHKQWTRNLKENVQPELELKALQNFQ